MIHAKQLCLPVPEGRLAIAAQCLAGIIGVAGITYVNLQLGLTLATVGFSYMVLIALLSLTGSLTGSILLSLIAVGCLNYFFTEPLFSLKLAYSQDVVALAAFVTTSIVITGLSGKVRKSSEALRQREQQWREVFEHTPTMYFMLDAAGTVLSVNAFGAAQLGYTVDELVGRSVLEVFFAEDREEAKAYVSLCLETLGQLHKWELRKNRKDGTLLWVRENATAVRRARNDVVVLVACEDITERKRAEQALQESENHFRALIEHSYDVVLLVDAQGIVRYASPSVSVVLGYSSEDLVGRSGFDLVHPDQLDDAMARFAQVLAGAGNVTGVDRLLRHKDGTWRWTDGALSNLLHEAGVQAIVMNFRDVTERKQAEDARRESEQRFRDYAETASDWFWETGPDHYFTHFHAPRLIGDLEPFMGRARWEFATDRDEEPEKWRNHLADLEARRPFRGFTYRMTRPDGSILYVASSGKPVFDKEGAFLGYRGVSTDVTAAIRADQAEKALTDARAELAHMARLTTLGELTASIAHETNQPLTAVVTDAGASLRWLDGQSPNLDEARQALSRIVKNGHRASEIIGRIRALAKKSPIQAERLDLNETILGVIALMRSELHRNHIDLRTELADNLPIFVADRVQLQQVILNLIMNAIEAMVDDGPRELVIASGKEDAEHVLVAVRDSGTGLDPRGINRLFEAFYTTKRTGIGMGLAISRSIIEAHGGRLWATANVPRGAVFQFTLPVEKEASADPISSTSTPLITFDT